MKNEPRNSMNKRGAYFYVIDAFIASIIIMTTLIVIFTSYAQRPTSAQIFYSGEDFLANTDKTQVRDMDNDVVRGWIRTKVISDPKASILQQLAVFKINSDNDELEDLANITASSVPPNIGLRILVDGQTAFEQNTQTEQGADVLLSSKRIVLVRKNNAELYPPVVIEAQTWQ